MSVQHGAAQSVSRSARAWAAVLVLGGSVLGACDGVGRALVDRRTNSATQQNPECSVVPSCRANPPISPVRSTQLELPENCRSAPEILVRNTDELLAAGDCSCGSRAILPLEEASAPAAERAEGLTFRECALRVEASRPYTLELAAGALERATIQLRGPVTLVLTKTSGNVLRVETHATERGAPSLQLMDSDLQFIHVVEGSSKGGHLSARYSNLARADISVDSVSLTSVLLTNASVSARTLDAADLSARGVTFTVGHAVFAASTVSSSQLDGCESLLMVGGVLVETRLATCQEPAQLYDMDVTLADLNGPLESVASLFVQSRFGTSHDTWLRSWGGGVTHSTLCAGSTSAHFEDSLPFCVDCQGPLTEPDADVCVRGPPAPNEDDEDAGVSARLENLCPSLIEPPTCERFPEPRRPH